MRRRRVVLAGGLVLALAALHAADTALVSRREDAGARARDVAIAKLAWEARIHSPGSAEVDYPLPLADACRGKLVGGEGLAAFWEEPPWIPKETRSPPPPGYLGVVVVPGAGDHVALEPDRITHRSFMQNLVQPRWLVHREQVAPLDPDRIRYLVVVLAAPRMNAEVYDRRAGTVACRGVVRPGKAPRTAPFEEICSTSGGEVCRYAPAHE